MKNVFQEIQNISNKIAFLILSIQISIIVLVHPTEVKESFQASWSVFTTKTQPGKHKYSNLKEHDSSPEEIEKIISLSAFENSTCI